MIVLDTPVISELFRQQPNAYAILCPPASACAVHAGYVRSMATNQVREGPEEVSRALKAMAALERLSLSDYVDCELQRIALKPSRAEILARIAERPAKNLPPAEDVLAEARASR